MSTPEEYRYQAQQFLKLGSPWFCREEATTFKKAGSGNE
jgi:hypothetical protein